MRWLVLGAIMVVAVAMVGMGAKGGIVRETGIILRHSVADVFRSGDAHLVADIDLGEAADGNVAPEERSAAGYAKEDSGSAAVAEGQGSEAVLPEPPSPSSPQAQKTGIQAASSVITVSVAPVATCDFGTSGAFSRSVILNEIAWMGTSMSSNNEWIELKNQGGQKTDLGGFELVNQSGTLAVKFSSGAGVGPGGFFLLVRPGLGSVPGIPADDIYAGALSNGGEWLKLFDANCGLVDEIDARSGWEGFGGENITKRTLERNVSDLGWHASVISGGTPRANNSIPFSSPSPQAPPPQPPPVPTPQPTPAQTSPTSSVTAHIVISEVLAGIDGNSDYEFIELYNAAADPADLAGWELRKRSSTGAESNLVDNGKFMGTIPAHGYFLVASPAYNGMPAADLLYSATSASLAYASNSVALYSGDHVSAPVVDEVSWSEIPKNQSYARDLASGSFSLNATPTPQNTQSL